jgi:hypothetical protein
MAVYEVVYHTYDVDRDRGPFYEIERFRVKDRAELDEIVAADLKYARSKGFRTRVARVRRVRTKRLPSLGRLRRRPVREHTRRTR